MFNRIMIANRGEIALRIQRTCKEMGIRTVQVHSEVDFDSLPVRLADEYICIGPDASSESYLNIPRIITAAEICNVEAIHPGYGFLSEDPHFAEVCRSCNIVFIGPSPETMAAIGNKAVARKNMRKAGIPVIPGSENSLVDLQEALAIAHEIGYPLMVKAAAGGGGRGLRLVHNDMSLISSFMIAKSEAQSSFANSSLYLEKFLEECRHIEVQILADHHGKVVHLGERDCTIQRRYQKLIEETPSPVLTPKLRKAIGDAALKVGKELNYRNAGTIEFLLTPEKQFYFMEANARIQVEHGVTEMVTGMDLIAEQIKIANGEPLSFSQKDIRMNGAAIQCRVYAEDAEHDFRPSPGEITVLNLPGGPGVRIDTHIYQGYNVPSCYDSLIAKVLVLGKTRDDAIIRMRRAMEEFIIEGIHSTIPLTLRILNSQRFQQGSFTVKFLEDLLSEG